MCAGTGSAAQVACCCICEYVYTKKNCVINTTRSSHFGRGTGTRRGRVAPVACKSRDKRACIMPISERVCACKGAECNVEYACITFLFDYFYSGWLFLFSLGKTPQDTHTGVSDPFVNAEQYDDSQQGMWCLAARPLSAPDGIYMQNTCKVRVRTH